jgi:hypothetical protein
MTSFFQIARVEAFGCVSGKGTLKYRTMPADLLASAWKPHAIFPASSRSAHSYLPSGHELPVVSPRRYFARKYMPPTNLHARSGANDYSALARVEGNSLM